MPDVSTVAEVFSVGEELFISRMDSLENLLVVQIVGIGLVVGLLFATLIMRFFDVR